MRINFRILFILVFAFTTIQCVARKRNDAIKYEIASAGSGVQGTTLVKVWVYDKSGKVTDEQLKYAAVHGVIFRGCQSAQGRMAIPSLAKSVTLEQQRSDFFELFFAKDGPYVNFANIVSNSYERIRLSKKGYKVGAVLSVSKSTLRKELEQAGIIKSLSSGF